MAVGNADGFLVIGPVNVMCTTWIGVAPLCRRAKIRVITKSSSCSSFFVNLTGRRLLNAVPTGIPSPIFPRRETAARRLKTAASIRGRNATWRPILATVFLPDFNVKRCFRNRDLDPGLDFFSSKTAVGCAVAQPKKSYHVAIVGATGAVGNELLRVLERRSFPVDLLVPLCSGRSAGRKITFRGEEIVAKELSRDSFAGVDLAFFSAGGNISRVYAPFAQKAGAIVIDNSSVFRIEPDVPLVIPEINGADVRQHRGLIANPNCTTAVTLMALYPLHRAFGVRRVVAASYQAVSGSGARAINELRSQVQAAAENQPAVTEIFPHPIAFNLLPHVDSFLSNGYTKEEMKMQNEGRRIMHLPDFRASVTCVRVPVYRAHSVAVSAEFERPVTVEEAHEVLAKAPGLELVDEPQNNRYPMPLFTSGRQLQGRVRRDCAKPVVLVSSISVKGAASTLSRCELLWRPRIHRAVLLAVEAVMASAKSPARSSSISGFVSVTAIMGALAGGTGLTFGATSAGGRCRLLN